MNVGRRVTIDSPLPPRELSARLAPHIGADVGPIANQANTSVDFLGDAGPTVVYIKRRHLYMNSFSPVFEGHIEQRDGGSRVVGEFRLRKSVVAILHLFTGLGVFFAAIAVLGVFTFDKRYGAFVLMAMAAFCIGMGRGAPRLMSAGDRQDIERLLREAASPESRS